MWTSNQVLLIAARKLFPFGNYKLPVKLYNRWYWFNDEAKSNTREIVMREINSGFYSVADNIPDGAIIFDIGAHVGIFSIPLAVKYPNAKFICVEPDPKNYENLIVNARRYNVLNKNLFAVNAGVWDKETKILSMHERGNSGGSFTVETDGFANCVYGYPLKELTDIFYNQKIWLMKMDCEGAEFRAIKSFFNVDNVERFIGEIHRAPGRDDKKLDRILQRIPKYRYVKIKEGPNEYFKNW